MKFENGLKTYYNNPDKWNIINELIPNKKKEDIIARFQKLLYDISRIENNEIIEIKHKKSNKNNE